MRINKIVRGERGISADTALRLARYFGMSVEFWTGIQTHYEVEMARMAPVSSPPSKHISTRSNPVLNESTPVRRYAIRSPEGIDSLCVML